MLGVMARVVILVKGACGVPKQATRQLPTVDSHSSG